MTNQQLKAHCEDVIANPHCRVKVQIMMTERDREQFEEWFADHSGQTVEWVKAQRETDKHYKIGPEIQRFWMAWQAGRATQPASPALKLPDGWVAVPNEPTEDMIAAGSAVDGGVYCIWKDMIFAAPDAPHTAPIEPICATGGAEWVKCSERMPDDDTLCLGIDADGVIWTMHYDCGELVTDTYGVELPDITHWMPLPAAPVA